MDILLAEKTRKLLEDRIQEARTLCLQEEQKLEKIGSTIASFDSLLKQRQSELESCTHLVEVAKESLVTIQNDIEQATKDKDATIINIQSSINEAKQQYDIALTNRNGIELDIQKAQRAYNDIQKELGEKNDELKSVGESLLSLLQTIEREKEELTNIVSSQQIEKQELVRLRREQSSQLNDIVEKTRILDQREADLNIIRNRYEIFAKENNLPFNV